MSPCTLNPIFFIVSGLVSKSSNFDNNVIKPGHNIKYHNVFLEFDNGLYCIYFMKPGHNIKYHNVFLEFDNGLYCQIPS